MKEITLTVLALLISISIFAQSPEAFNYQGVARDLSGNPLVNQNISLSISVLKNSTMGSEVYHETHSIITNQLGLFSIHIGSGIVVNGIFENIDWSTNNYYLQVMMDENGGSNYQLIGTSQLLSVPYALYAKNSGFWHSKDSTIYTYKNVGIGSEVSTALLTLTANSVEAQGREVLEINNLSNDYGSASRFDISAGTYANKASASLITFSKSYNLTEGYAGYTVLNGGYNLPGLIIRTQDENGLLRFLVGGNSFEHNEKLQINSSGLIKAVDGDVFIENVNKGVIMKSPNGQCWRMTVSNDGEAVFNSIPCPN